ncbi:MAG TPA: hypothetical protein VL172_14030 [Kofleriaceae bacterium]|nr:hypothetical protein [Kofleriaceae bacterium]
MLDPGGSEEERYADVLVDRAGGALNVTAPGDLVRTWPSMQLHFRVLDVGPAGEIILGDFWLDHSA